MNKDDIAAAMRLVYSTTPENVPGLRNTVKTQLSSRKYTMPEDSGIQVGIEKVEGLAFNLFLDANSKPSLKRARAASAASSNDSLDYSLC